MENIPPKKPGFADNHPRLSGAILTVIGAGAFYWAVIMPVLEAQRSEPFSIHMKGIGLGVLGLMFGLSYLVFGKRAVDFSKTSTALVIFLPLSIAVTAAIYYCLRVMAEKYGYHH